MLKNKIRKTLIETKEIKEKKLIESQIVRNRILMVTEGIKKPEDFKSLSEEKQLKLSVNLIQELSYLLENGLINESNFDLGGILKSLFGGGVETMFEPFFNSILSKLGIEGYLKNFLISALTTRPTELLQAFKDCKMMTKLIVESIVEAMVMELQKTKNFGGTFYDVLRNSIGNSIKSTEFVKNLESSIESTVCDLLSKYTDNAQNVLNKVKNVSGVANPTS